MKSKNYSLSFKNNYNYSFIKQETKQDRAETAHIGTPRTTPITFNINNPPKKKGRKPKQKFGNIKVLNTQPSEIDAINPSNEYQQFIDDIHNKKYSKTIREQRRPIMINCPSLIKSVNNQELIQNFFDDVINSKTISNSQYIQQQLDESKGLGRQDAREQYQMDGKQKPYSDYNTRQNPEMSQNPDISRTLVHRTIVHKRMTTHQEDIQQQKRVEKKIDQQVRKIQGVLKEGQRFSMSVNIKPQYRLGQRCYGSRSDFMKKNPFTMTQVQIFQNINKSLRGVFINYQKPFLQTNTKYVDKYI